MINYVHACTCVFLMYVTVGT